ncbi:MAG TPA: right-handed parallel beta-helix repeat-containing protein [Longimicrobiales bacterium]
MRRIQRVTVAGCTLVVLGAGGCTDVPMQSRRAEVLAPRFATVITERVPYTPPQDSTGAYLLPKACDVLIGEPAVEAGDPAATMYAHQLFVDVPAGSTVRLLPDTTLTLPAGVEHDVMLDDTGTPAPGGTVFGCDARDPDDPTQPVVDPVTGEPAKGNGIVVGTSGITLDLNGYGIRSWISAASFDPALEGVGIAVAGSGVTVTNSRVDGADGGPVISVVSGFADNIDIEAENPTLSGLVVDHDGDPATPDEYNLVVAGSVRLRRFTGTATVNAIASVGPDPAAGEGLLLRDCLSQSVTVTNSRFIGGAEGVFIRECSGVTFEDNFVSSPSGNGISTREAQSLATSPIVIRDNTIADTGLSGILWGRESVNAAGLTIEGNDISGWGTCGFELGERDAEIAPLTLAQIEAANTFPANAANTTCVEGG